MERRRNPAFTERTAAFCPLRFAAVIPQYPGFLAGSYKSWCNAVSGQHSTKIVILIPDTVNAVFRGESPLLTQMLKGAWRAAAKPSTCISGIRFEDNRSEATFSKMQGCGQTGKPCTNNDD